MSVNHIDAKLCADMFLAGADSLERSKEWINELNVFPVPDGDTGTNMTMTIKSAADEVRSLDEITMSRLSKAMSSGSLRGARGNSGVILSQLLRGFCKSIRDHDRLDTAILCSAFEKAVETAYKAVMKPKEGTILTVARGFSEEAAALLASDPNISMEQFLGGALEHAEDVLKRTPDMLPVLKEAGVVDSGGQGLVEILKGAFDLYTGKKKPEDVSRGSGEEAASQEEEETTPAMYCVRMAVQLYKAKDMDLSVRRLKEVLKKTPDTECFEVLPEERQIRIHAHTMHPGILVEEAISQGIIKETAISGPAGSQCQHPPKDQARVSETAGDRAGDGAQGAAASSDNEKRKDVGFVAVAVGDGLHTIFRDLGADQLIEGGQTMNPSTEEVVNAIRSACADTVFVFPNNKNIILAASQAQSMIDDVKVFVIPTKTIPQGISALISYSPELSPEENEQAMYEEIDRVKTCSLTYAVRDTHIAGKSIHEGDIMGVGDTGILAVGKELFETAVDSVKEMVSDDSELISIYYGEDITAEDAQPLADKLSELFPECEVELNEGGQPVYYYIISVE